MDVIAPIVVIVAYFLLMRYVLPRMGIPTWMSNACDFQSDRPKDTQKENDEAKKKW